MHKRGYSLIELMITLAVSVVLLSVGIARYNAYIGQQDFAASGQSVIECIQKAQQVAVSGTLPSGSLKSLRYTVAEVKTQAINGSSGVTCDIYAYDATQLTVPTASAGGTLVGSMSPALMKYSIGAPTGVPDSACLKKYSGSSGMFRIVFGVFERGLPLDVNFGNGTAFTGGTDDPKGQGFSSCFTLISGDGLASALVVGSKGTPVSLYGNVYQQ